MARATEGLAALCQKHGIPDSHGLAHATRVLGHAEKAVEAAAVPVPAHRALAIRLAALLHDADDRKYFKGRAKGEEYLNAIALSKEAGAPPPVVEEVVRMIDMVSCSKNGNSIPKDLGEDYELLYPRWADRLEASGEIGVVRCWQCSLEFGDPQSCEDTPRPKTAEEVWGLATEERFAEYQRTGGGSKSMMDHYYDKLLRVARPDKRSIRNSYLEAEMDKRAAPLVRICLAFGQTGQVPEDEIKAMADRV